MARQEQEKLEAALRRTAREIAAALDPFKEQPRAAGRRELSRLIAAAPFAVLAHDDRQRYIAVNGPASALLGYAEPELLALSVQDIVASEPPGAAAPSRRTFIRGGVQEGELPLIRADGLIVVVTYAAVVQALRGVHLSVMAPTLPASGVASDGRAQV
ncbi:MAG TPA: PAS domain-containing protein [Vicinamibacterales bacterium]|nr:PAS domain-containing protein [Vicinamibacterales bacterium]